MMTYTQIAPKRIMIETWKRFDMPTAKQRNMQITPVLPSYCQLMSHGRFLVQTWPTRNNCTRRFPSTSKSFPDRVSGLEPMIPMRRSMNVSLGKIAELCAHH